MKYNIILDEQALEIIATGLNELPRKYSQPVFELINRQVIEQKIAQSKEDTDEGGQVEV
jgi:hypothetical protein